MEQRYNIYFDGQILEGQQLTEVRGRLAKLFNADEPTLDRLFSGKAQLLKRDCDKATALKYKQAIERAGALPIVKSAQDTPAAAAPPASPAPAPAPSTPEPMTAAERIAALAAAPDMDNYRADAAQSAPQAAQTSSEPGDPDIAPAGSDVLRPQERQQVVQREIDTTGLELGAPVERLSPEPPPAPAAPDTSHLDMGNVGETIPTLTRDVPPPPPQTLDVDLAPAGADFSEFAAPMALEPSLDLSDIALAPTGSDVLEEKYRPQDQVAAPDTRHISLED